MATIMKARFPLLLLLGIVFLASVSVSFGIAYWEQENPSHHMCLQSCNKEIDAYRHDACESRCKLVMNREEREPQRERGRQEGEKEEEKERKEREKERKEREKEQREREKRREEKRREKRQEREEQEEEEGSESRREKRNPFHFTSNRYQTLYENEHGYIRVLQRFDERSKQFENLQNYRIVGYNLKPNTIRVPQHADADFLLVVVSGQALVTVLNPDDRDSYKLERGDALRIPAGTTSYLANRGDNQNLRIVKLAIPVNRPGKLQVFSPSDNEKRQSYFRGFSKNILEASFNTKYDEIEKILLGEEEQEQEQQQEKKQQSEEEGLIIKVSKEQIQEMSKHAKSSSKKSKSSEDEPFNLRSRGPIYSNKFGKFFEITPKKNPQLEDLNVFLSVVEINEGSLLLPYFNSEATVLLYVVEGEGYLELVGPRQQQQEQEQEEEEKQQQQQQVQRYRAKLSKNEVIVIPAGHPVAVNASSDLRLLGFGINAENNQRNFLAGENDNVISQIPKPVKEITFPGSAEDVDRLIRNQKNSYFVSARPQQQGEEGKQRRSLPLSSILGAFY
ncbi:provicilin-like [Gastrolobium bilobum]|uniref:provicilin-like n=1 Tax=Gastrolobium bilobum TaxID=150636 RepID=UPI002AB0BE21|nr:provicilin-like [Gastrolobium bilobum]